MSEPIPHSGLLKDFWNNPEVDDGPYGRQCYGQGNFDPKIRPWVEKSLCSWLGVLGTICREKWTLKVDAPAGDFDRIWARSLSSVASSSGCTHVPLNPTPPPLRVFPRPWLEKVCPPPLVVLGLTVVGVCQVSRMV